MLDGFQLPEIYFKDVIDSLWYSLFISVVDIDGLLLRALIMSMLREIIP